MFNVFCWGRGEHGGWRAVRAVRVGSFGVEGRFRRRVGGRSG